MFKFRRTRKFMKERIPRLMGVGHLSSLGRSVKERAHSLITPDKPTRHESFDEAIKRFGLTEQEVFQKQREFFRLSLLMAVASLLVFAYTIYLLWHGSFHAAVASFAIFLVTLVFSFRFHFWYFQLKQRKLGMTLREWFDKACMGKK